MSDPYNRGAFGDPQSLAILDQLDRRKASSFHSLQIERDKVESGCVDALRKWGQKPSLPIHLAIEGYFKNKDTPEQLRRAEFIAKFNRELELSEEQRNQIEIIISESQTRTKHYHDRS